MTFSPDLSVFTKAFLNFTCSAIKGEILALMPPVPSPMIIMAAIKPPNAALCKIAVGSEVQTKMTSPTT